MEEYLQEYKKAVEEKDEYKLEFLKKINTSIKRQVEKLSPCWIWGGSVSPSSHRPTFQTNYWKEQKIMYSNRISYVLFKGEIQDTLDVCHTCETKDVGSHYICVNPYHLETKSHSDNMKDRDKNLGSYQTEKTSGENCGTALFTIEEAQNIQKDYLTGNFLYTELADKYKSHRRTIERICIGATYGLPDCREVLKKRKEELHKKVRDYLTEGKAPSWISKELKISASSISNIKNNKK